MAEYIAETLEADTFEITSAEIYTSDDLDSYDVVFIGYPKMWYGFLCV